MLAQFLKGAGERPYRELIQWHIRKQSTSKLQQACLGETANLPEDLRPLVMDYIDATNARFGYDQRFWIEATCRSAFEEIIKIAIELLQIKERITSLEDALRPENQELAFSVFQISTLSFAYSASTQKAQRKFMGISKGFLDKWV